MYINDDFHKYTKFTPIQCILNIYDTNRVWLAIPGYNGYEISNDNIVRSMKHFKKYPYGIQIQPANKDVSDPVYTLSNNDNKRVNVKLSEILALVKDPKTGVLSGIPKATIVTDGGSRNKFVKNKNGAYMKVYNGPIKTSRNPKPIDNSTSIPKFTIIDDDNN